MTALQIENADLEKIQYAPKKKNILTEEPWRKNGRMAQKILTIQNHKKKETLRITVAFASATTQEVEESWCERI